MALRIDDWGLLGSLVMGSLYPAIALAQITPDSSLGTERSQVNPGTVQGLPADVIEGGARRGANLFHSFSEFNVGDRQQVYFGNPAGVTNILTRITGSNASKILGTLGVNGAANLYLLNPNGILFGPNARLDIRGSFLASTADSFQFDLGVGFSASKPQSPPLLTVNTPIGLQFGPTPGGILYQGVRQNELQVGLGQTLAVVGGEVVLDAGNLTAVGGRIELGSVGSGSFVSLTPTQPGWKLGYQGVQQFQDIRLTRVARINAGSTGSGRSGGSIQVQGQRVSLTDGALMVTLTGENQAGNDLTIRASAALELSGFHPEILGRSGRLATEAQPGSTGNAGNLIIETPNLLVADGTTISASALGAGKGGDLIIRAQSIEVIGFNQTGTLPSDLLTQAGRGATGNAGNLTIETQSLRVANGAVIATGTSGVGNAGNLTIQAQSIQVTGFNQVTGIPSSLAASANATSAGNAGQISLLTDRLEVSRQGEIRTTSEGLGSAGNIQIQANEQMTLTDAARITADTNAQQGNISLTTPLLVMRRGSRITTNATGLASGGNITINAGFLVSAPNENNDIIANAFDGSGGRIAIATQGLFWFDVRTRQDLQRLLSTTNPTALDPRRLLTNDITAFSQANPVIDTGSVTIQTPNLDPLRQISPLLTNFSDPSQLIASTCPADRGSSFAITGRGGLPEDPRQPLMGPVIWADERGGGGDEGDEGVKGGREVGGVGMVEAQGWIVEADGTIALVARHQQSPVFSHPTCAQISP